MATVVRSESERLVQTGGLHFPRPRIAPSIGAPALGRVPEVRARATPTPAGDSATHRALCVRADYRAHWNEVSNFSAMTNRFRSAKKSTRCHGTGFNIRDWRD